MAQPMNVTGSSPIVMAEFSETPNQAYFYANVWFCTHNFPAGDSNLRQFFFCWRSFFLFETLNFLKTPEDDSGSPNLALVTKDQEIAANRMPQGLS